MRFELLFDANQLAHFDELLEGRQKRAIDAHPVLEAIADDFLELERNRFASGATWRPDTPSWTARKARMGRSTRTLVFTGTLEKSLTVKGAKYSKRRVERQRVTVGTKDPVGNLLRRGTPGRSRSTTAPRPPVEIPDERIEVWGEWIADYLTGGTVGGRNVGL